MSRKHQHHSLFKLVVSTITEVKNRVTWERLTGGLVWIRAGSKVEGCYGKAPSEPTWGMRPWDDQEDG